MEFQLLMHVIQVFFHTLMQKNGSCFMCLYNDGDAKRIRWLLHEVETYSQLESNSVETEKVCNSSKRNASKRKECAYLLSSATFSSTLVLTHSVLLGCCVLSAGHADVIWTETQIPNMRFTIHDM